MVKRNKKLTSGLEGVCLGVGREAEVGERRWGLFGGDGAGRNAGGCVYSSSLLASTMRAITEVSDVSEQTHLENYLCLIYADL